MNRGMFVVAVFLGLGVAQSSLADDTWIVGPDQWYFSPMIGMSFEDQDHTADNGIAASLGIGKQIADNWALEFSLFGGQHGGYTEFNPYGIGVDLLRNLGQSGLVSPYLVFGTGYLKGDVVERPNFVPELDYDNLIATAGIGLIAPLGDAAARFRGEIRYRLDMHDPSFTDVLVMAGLYFPIGDADSNRTTRENARLPDDDGDGVANDIDLCPGTVAGMEIDKYGCELDSDGDSVPNSKDRCPATPRATAVDSRGCKRATDSDGDGVADGNDRCPGTPRSAMVDKTGCEKDDDGDGVVNSLDSCPKTAAGARIDVRGCEIRGKIELPGVSFELNSANLVRESTAILDQAAATLRNNPALKVEAAGYTDTSGNPGHNLSLSKSRAEAVRRYLISKGADGDNITARGYGEANPIADNATRPGRKANRRVELRILN